MNHSENSPKVSIITVVYNGEKYIENTIQSVLSQDYTNIEYIIIDGLSKDKTIEIIQKYSSNISIFISEKDKGIYDAMNKGLSVATGDYVWFMNAGDIIPGTDTVTKMFENHQHEDVIYGFASIMDENGQVIGERGHKVPEKLNWKSFSLGMVVCHQSLLISKKIAQSYNLEYKIAADLDWAIRSTFLAKSFKHTHLHLCHYLAGGFSDQKRKEALKERFRIHVQHYGWLTTLFAHAKIAWNFIFHKKLNWGN